MLTQFTEADLRHQTSMSLKQSNQTRSVHTQDCPTISVHWTWFVFVAFLLSKSGWAGPTLQTYWCPHTLRMPSVKRDNANNWPIGVCRSEICHQAENSREALLHCWPCVPRYCYIGDNPDISQLSHDFMMTADTMTPNRHQAICISHAHSIMSLVSHDLYYVSHI